MSDSKSSMGLWSNTHQSIVNIKQDLLGIGTVVQNQVLPQLQKMSDLLKSSRSGSSKNVGGNVVADNGVHNTSSDNNQPPNQPPSNKVSASGSPSENTRGGFGNGVVNGAAGLGGALYSSLPSTNTSVLQDLLTVRSAFYGQGGYSGSSQDQANRVRSLEKSLANNGTAINPMDTTRALAQAQSSGLTGTNNFNQVMQGAAQASNFVPGMGVEAVTASVGGVLNAPTTVNLAKTIGINVRDSNGNMLPLPQLVDKIWNYLKTTAGPGGMNKKDMEFSFQPGYGLYNMLNGLVGGDPQTFTIVKNLLLAKAQFNGAPLSSITKNQLQDANIISGASRALASQTAAQTGVLVSTSAAAAGGAAAAADIGTGMNRLAASMSDLTSAIAASKGFGSSLGGAEKLGLGLGGSALLKKVAPTVAAKGLGKVLPFVSKLIPGLAETSIADILPLLFLGLKDGGPTDAKTPYIVGEEGPELFIPKTNGTIIPNHALGLNRESGGPVLAGGASGYTQEDFAKALITGLGGTPTAKSIQNVLMWEGKEGGNWHNTAKFNPLNTSYQEKGSTNFNTSKYGSGVQSYLSWQQGIDASIKTLTGKDAQSRGYTDIVKSLVGGGASNADFLKLMQASSWDAGRYTGVGGSSSSSSRSTKTSIVAATPSTSTVTPTTDPTAAARFAAARASAFGSSGGGITNANTNYNYGNITISVTTSADPKAVGKAVADSIKKLGKK